MGIAAPDPRPKYSPDLADFAYRQLRERIISGQMKSGETYNEIALARELGVSRTPLREALHRLEAGNLIRVQSRKGITVSTFVLADAEQVFELRSVLEGAAVRKLAQRAAACSLAVADGFQADCRAAVREGDVSLFGMADRRFHAELVALTGNRWMVSQTAQLLDVTDVMMAAHPVAARARMKDAVFEHELLLWCVRQGRVEAAVENLVQHLDATLRCLAVLL